MLWKIIQKISFSKIFIIIVCKKALVEQCKDDIKFYIFLTSIINYLMNLAIPFIQVGSNRLYYLRTG